MNTPTISESVTLVISTYNWPEALKQVLEGVFIQTVLPKEIIIADDGSTEDTTLLIEETRKRFPVPIIHVWQEDKGFRKTIILNKAIARASGDYIIQIDGDVIPCRHFIEDHIEARESGYFVCGSRVRLTPSGKPETSHIFNLIRSRFLRKLFYKKYGKDIGTHMRGCNLAYWKKDFISINGYNEDFTGWGYEDSELVYRLYFSGVHKKVLKFGGVVKHIWHKEASMSNREYNYNAMQDIIRKQSKWVDNGIGKYIENK